MTFRGLLIRATIVAIVCWLTTCEPEHMRYGHHDVSWSACVWTLVGVEWFLFELLLLCDWIDRRRLASTSSDDDKRMWSEE